MILQLLRATEQDPAVVFTESELRKLDPLEFERLRVRGLLTRLDLVGDLVARVVGDRLVVLIEGQDGTWEALDTEDPDEAPVALPPDDVYLWRLDLLKVCQVIAHRSGISGEPEKLFDRAYYIGSPSAGVAAVLMFLDRRAAFEHLVAAIPSRLGQAVLRICLVTPSFVPSKTFASLHPDITWNRLEDDSLALEFPSTSAGEQQVMIGAGIRATPDFARIWIAGKEYKASVNQRAVLAYLHENQREFGQDTVLEHLGIASARIHDVFRSGDGRLLRDSLLLHLGQGRWSWSPRQ